MAIMYKAGSSQDVVDRIRIRRMTGTRIIIAVLVSLPVISSGGVWTALPDTGCLHDQLVDFILGADLAALFNGQRKKRAAVL
jgi:hypothetical protein